MMRITLCGSLNFAKEIKKIRERLIEMGHEVYLPKSIEKFSIKDSKGADALKNDQKFYIKIKPNLMKEHFDKIEESDAILVVNLERHGIENYIGGNTFAEIIIAFHNKKRIFFLNPIPKNEELSFIADEIEAVNPIILNGNLDNINNYQEKLSSDVK